MGVDVGLRGWMRGLCRGIIVHLIIRWQDYWGRIGLRTVMEYLGRRR